MCRRDLDTGKAFRHSGRSICRNPSKVTYIAENYTITMARLVRALPSDEFRTSSSILESYKNRKRIKLNKTPMAS